MGERSKNIGEHGERLVKEFLSIIGWKNPLEGESISCLSPKAHEKSDTKGTHGIDFFHSEKSNLSDHTLDNVLISVKYSADAYPKYPTTLFKKHLKDIADTASCFARSDLRADNDEQYSRSGIKRSIQTGVLFWLTNNRESDQDVVSKISSINLDKNLKFSSIHVIDNQRASFIFDTISFLKNKFTGKRIAFHYAFSATNYKDPYIDHYGDSLPVEYLTSNTLPFRIIDPTTNKSTFCIASNEDFSEENLSRLLSLARDVSQDFTNDFTFIFPNYDELEQKRLVNSAIRSLGKNPNTNTINVYSFKSEFRGLINE